MPDRLAKPETRLVNLLPHDLVVLNGASFVLASSGHVARMEQHVVDDVLLHVPGAVLPLATVQYGAVSALQAPQPGVLLVVSRAVAAEVPRVDLVFPDLEIRDENRRIVGCQRLARFTVGDS
ncbi:MAG: hypothetical protein ACRDTT_28125 [Pseudonocardiaceae bacterium]